MSYFDFDDDFELDVDLDLYDEDDETEEEEETFHHYLVDNYFQPEDNMQFQSYISLDSTVTEKVVITAIVKNDVATLKKCMSEPIFIKAKYNYSLLHIAINERSRDAFDYLLEIGCPMDLKSENGCTPFMLSMDGEALTETEYFAIKLVNNGAELEVSSFLDSPLYVALTYNCYDLSKLLIAKLDVDELNLHYIMASNFSEEKTIELVCAMIYYGADVWVKNSYGFTPFDLSLQKKFYQLQEILFDYYIDDLTECYEIEGDIDFLIRAFQSDSPTLPKLLPCLKLSEKVDEEQRIFEDFLLIKPIYLEWLLENYESTVKYILKYFEPFRSVDLDEECVEEKMQYSEMFTFLELLLKNTKFRLQILNFFLDFSYYCKASGKLSDLLFLFLSYGMELNEDVLNWIYKDFGYCDLFKTLLFMDIALEKQHFCVMPTLIYDVHVTLEEFLKKPLGHYGYYWEDLSPYFAYSRFSFVSSPFIKPDEQAVLAPFSTLKELARDASRKFIVDKFSVKNSRQFYTILNKLDICDVYKKIISFEIKLYN